MVEAIYEPTGDKCFLGMDYVIDVFPHKDGYIAYTIDLERGGYIISKDEFNRLRGEKE